MRRCDSRRILTRPTIVLRACLRVCYTVYHMLRKCFDRSTQSRAIYIGKNWRNSTTPHQSGMFTYRQIFQKCNTWLHCWRTSRSLAFTSFEHYMHVWYFGMIYVRLYHKNRMLELHPHSTENKIHFLDIRRKKLPLPLENQTQENKSATKLDSRCWLAWREN